MDKNIQDEVRKEIKLYEHEIRTKYNTNLKIYVAFSKEDYKSVTSLDDLFQTLISVLEKYDPGLIKYFTTDAKTRTADYCNYLHAFCYHARNLGYTYQKIGSYMNKNHATIIHSKRKAQELLDTNDAEFLIKFNKLTKTLEAHVGIPEQDIEI